MKRENYEDYEDEEFEREESQSRRTLKERIWDKQDAIADWWDGVSPERKGFTRFLLIFVVVLAICAVVFFMFFFKGCSSEQPSTSSETSTVASSSAASSEASEQSNEEKYKDSLHALSEDTYTQLGLDGQRIARDSQIIEEFSKTAFTFSNAEEYANARSQLASTYKAFDKSQFASEFMPDIDADIKSSLEFRSVNCYATAGKDDIYSYVCDVYVVVTSSNGGRLEGDVVLCCDTDSEGELSNLQAYSAMSL